MEAFLKCLLICGYQLTFDKALKNCSELWVCGLNIAMPPLLLLSRFSRVRLCATPEMAAHQAPPWDSPGKNTEVSCHFLLQCMKVKSESEVAQSCPTPIDPMDYSLPGSSVHGICQARVLEWGHKFLLFLLLSYILRVLWSDRKQPCGCCPSLLEFLPMQFSCHAVGKHKQPSERPMWRGSAAWSKPLTDSPEPF